MFRYPVLSRVLSSEWIVLDRGVTCRCINKGLAVQGVQCRRQWPGAQKTQGVRFCTSEGGSNGSITKGRGGWAWPALGGRSPTGQDVPGCTMDPPGERLFAWVPSSWLRSCWNETLIDRSDPCSWVPLHWKPASMLHWLQPPS